MNALTTLSTTALVPHNMDEAIRLAEFMARARTVPKHLWDSPGDCLMVVELAMRWGMSPFAVAQATSVVNGKQMIEGKLVAAAVENSGAIVGHIDYDFAGEADGRSITVTATRRGETNPRTVTVKLADAKTANQMWVKQPDQQLVYHGARVWARRWTPAVILGVYSREEMGPVIEGEAIEHNERDEINEKVPLKAVAADTPRAPKMVDPTPYEAPPKSTPAKPERTDDQWRGWLVKLRDACAVLRSRSEVEEVASKDTVGDALRDGPPWVRREIDDILADSFARFAGASADELSEVEIAGAEKAGA